VQRVHGQGTEAPDGTGRRNDERKELQIWPRP
jgi:hypothetical protein